MIDYLILTSLLFVIFYCNILTIRLKRLKLNSTEMISLVNKLNTALITAKSESSAITGLLNKATQKCTLANEKTALIVDDVNL